MTDKLTAENLAQKIWDYLPATPEPRAGWWDTKSAPVDENGACTLLAYSEAELSKHGFECAHAVAAALIAERDGYRGGWSEIVEILGGKGLDCDDAQYHACVLAPKLQALLAERDAQAKRIAELEADRDRLDWLDANNIPKRMGWAVGTAPAGNVSVSSVVFLGSEPVTIRAAIDAARAEARDG